MWITEIKCLNLNNDSKSVIFIKEQSGPECKQMGNTKGIDTT